MNQPLIKKEDTITVVVPPDAGGERLDKFISRLFPEHSREAVKQFICQHRVFLNHRLVIKTDHRLGGGESITINWPPPSFILAPPTPTPVNFQILFEDEDLLILNKPPGLIVHPSQNEKEITLVHGLLNHDRTAFSAMLDRDMRPGIVHRLDKNTSGIMIVAKNQTTQNFLKAAFKQRKVEKLYLALASGELKTPAGTIEGPIGRHPRNRKKMAVLEETGKPARTVYQVVSGNKKATLLEVRIETGRTHQIRVHLAKIKHPVLGDEVYGGKKRVEGVEPKRQMLHSRRLVFPHPKTGALKECEASLPDDFQQCLNQLGL